MPHQRSNLRRADRILGAFDLTHSTLSLAGLIARTGLPKTTVYRATEQMISLGWLKHQAHRYSIGSRLFELTAPARLRLALREAVLPVMEDLHEATHETVRLAILEDHQVLTAEMILRRGGSRRLGRVGGRLPAHCTAVGKVLLAFAEPELVTHIVASGLEARTFHTIVSSSKLRSELAGVRSTHVAYDREECEVGVVCVAAPVTIGSMCVAAISLTGPTHRLRAERHAIAIRAAALGASRALRNASAVWTAH